MAGRVLIGRVHHILLKQDQQVLRERTQRRFDHRALHLQVVGAREGMLGVHLGEQCICLDAITRRGSGIVVVGPDRSHDESLHIHQTNQRPGAVRGLH